jgi:hypothetical protein
MIEALPNFPDGVVGFRCADQITRQDYEAVVIPALNAAVAQHKTLRAHLEVVSFDGVSPGALWDDVKVGLEHFGHWERVAVVTDIDWVSTTSKLFAFLIPGGLRVFPLAEAEKAREWIVDPNAANS